LVTTGAALEPGVKSFKISKGNGGLYNMQAPWWEDIMAFICGWWWVILLIIVLVLTAYFTRDYWLPGLMSMFSAG
jgi:hypothetical protein